MSETDQGRRAFLRGAFLTTKRRERAERQLKAFGPSPPWLDQARQSGVCDDYCEGECATHCKQGVIKRHPSGHPEASTPYLDFSDDGCTFCGDCADHCPIGITRLGEKPRIGTARLSTTRCFAWRDITCMSCNGVCPEKAIKGIEHQRPQVDPLLCTGCGLCVVRCPPEAFTIVS